MKRYIIVFLYIYLIAFTISCSQTQLATHITKHVIRNTETTDVEKNTNTQSSKPIYKVGNPYYINGIRYIPKELNRYYEIGIASWYGPNFHGKATANGEVFNQYDITAAHKILPLPSLVKVINLENSRELIVRINDRGPFIENRIIDLSLKSAQLLGMQDQGTAKVSVELLDYGPHLLVSNNKDINTIEVNENKSYFIQVGVFSNATNADNFARELRNENYILYKVSVLTFNRDNKLLYIVRIGPLEDKEDLMYVKRNLERNNIDSKIVLEPS